MKVVYIMDDSIWSVVYTENDNIGVWFMVDVNDMWNVYKFLTSLISV